MIRIQRAPWHGVAILIKPLVLIALSSSLFAQFRGSTDWSVNGGDAQRSSWVRSDPKINPASVLAPGFQLLWKQKFDNQAEKSNSLSSPVLMDRYIGYRGFRTYAFIGGSGENAFAMDSDLGRIEWQKHFPVNPSSGSAACPGGMTASLTRPVTAAFPSANAPRFGGGRGGPAKSGVGQPFEGAVTISQAGANRPPTPPPAAPASNASNQTGTAARRPTSSYSIFEPHPTYVYSLSSDGSFHRMYVSNGVEPDPALKFIPANANVGDFSVVDDIAYATTINHCGNVSDGIWALDLETKAVVNWQGVITGGETAFAPTGQTYLTSGSKLLGLDAKTLSPGASYDAGQPFSTAPLVFEYKTKAMIAAATGDGVLHLFDASSLGTELAKSPAGDASPYALASWQTVAATRWVVVTSAKSITAWKLIDQNGALSFQKSWSVTSVPSPASPLIINGVLFALERGDHSHNSVLYAFDASSGKQLWTSGNTLSSYVPKFGGLAAGGSSVYLGTHDGTLWDFGFPIEH